MTRKSYPSDVSDEGWALVASYLVLLPEAAGQRRHALRETFNRLRHAVETGAPWRGMPNDLPPWDIVYGQARRWLAAGVFEAIAHDLRVAAALRGGSGRGADGGDPRQPHAALHARERGACGLRWGAGARRAAVHAAVDTLGHLLAPHVTPATADDRAAAGRLAGAVQEATGQSVEIAFVDQGCTGEKPAEAAAAHGIRLKVARHHEAERGFVLPPGRWVVERSFAWATRLRRLVRDHERLPHTLAGLHIVAFACLMLKHAALVQVHSSL